MSLQILICLIPYELDPITAPLDRYRKWESELVSGRAGIQIQAVYWVVCAQEVHHAAE